MGHGRGQTRRAAVGAALLAGLIGFVFPATDAVAARRASAGRPVHEIVLGDWTVTAHGHCVHQRVLAYGRKPFVGGELFSWAATASLCDAGSAAAVSSLHLTTQVLIPPVTATEPGCEYANSKYVFSKGSVVANATDAHDAATTYFEYGNGDAAPPDSLGTTGGVRPQPLWGCAGKWHVQVTTSVKDAASTTPIVVAQDTAALRVARNPQWDEPPRPAFPVGDSTVTANGHCTRNRFQLYSDGPPVVGDLLEYLGSASSCDAPGAAPIHGLQVRITTTPPAGCTARPWMYTSRGAGVGESAPIAPGDGAGDFRYRDGRTPPPDDAFGGGGSGALSVVNCPGTWTIELDSRVSIAEEGPWIDVNDSVFSYTVVAAA